MLRLLAIGPVLALTAAAGSTGERLGEVAMTGDPAALTAAAAPLGATGLASTIAAGPRRARIAACRAAPTVTDGWLLLEPLAAAAGDRDRSVAVAAARAAEQIAESMNPLVLEEREIPRDRIDAAIDAWRAVADTADRWADVRVRALVVASRLGGAAGRDVGVEALLTDDEPEVRRAALELLPLAKPPLAAIADRLADPDPVVAVVAGQALCAGIAVGDAAAPRLAAAGDAGLDRLRALVADPGLPVVARVDAARCLAAAGDRATVRAMPLPRSLEAERRRLLGSRP